jgi:hypothetical protein
VHLRPGRLVPQPDRRHEEDDRVDHHPGEGLAAARRHRGDGIHADDGADEEEQDVEAAEVLLQLLQLLPFDIGGGQLGQGLGHRDAPRGHQKKHSALLSCSVEIFDIRPNLLTRISSLS